VTAESSSSEDEVPAESSSDDDDDDEAAKKGPAKGRLPPKKDAVGWLMDSFRQDIDAEKAKWAKLQARQDAEIAEMQAELDRAKQRAEAEKEKRRKREAEDEAQRKRIEQQLIERREREMAEAIAEAARPSAASLIGHVMQMVASDFSTYGSQLGQAATATVSDAAAYGSRKLAQLQGVDIAAHLVELSGRGGAKLSELRRMSALRIALVSRGVTKLPAWLMQNIRPAPPQAKTGVPTKRQAASVALSTLAPTPGTPSQQQQQQHPAPPQTPRKRAPGRVFVGGGLVEQPMKSAKRQVPQHKPPEVPPPATPPTAKPVAPAPTSPPPVPTAAKPARPTKVPPPPPTTKKPEVPTKTLPPPPPTSPKPPPPPTKPKPPPPQSAAKTVTPPPSPAVPPRKEPPIDVSRLGVSAVLEDLDVVPVARPKVSRRALSMRLMPAREGPDALQRKTPRGMRRIQPGAVVVLDNGSSFIKAGVAGEDVPRTVVPTMCGYVGDACYVGRPALLREGLKVACPIDPRRDTDWDALADVWEYVLCHEMHIDPTEHPLLMTEVPTMCEAARSKMAELLFESFEVPALSIQSSAVLSLYAQGLVTGLAVDCGNRMQIVPVVDGFVIGAAVSKTRHGLAGITEYLARLLAGRGFRYFSNNKQLEGVRRLKEALCYVAEDYAAESARPEKEIEASFVMPDGVTVTVGNERFQAPEAMFAPEMLGLDMEGLHKLTWKSLTKCPVDCRKSLLSSIVVSGGSTLFPGFAKRLERELLASAQGAGFSLRKNDVRIIAPGNRKYLSWVGGAVLGGVSEFVESSCLSREQYFEEGV